MGTILIAGASRGIGLALTTLYVARGDRVIATARRPAEATALSALTSSGLVECHPLDITDDAASHRLGAALASRDLDLAICNAGMMGARGGFDDPGNTAELWNDLLMTNVAGALFLARAVVPLLERRRGKLVFVSSRMGSSALAAGNAYAYRASKAAMTNIAANLACELKPRGIAVGAYHPGWVRTDMGGPGADISVEESANGLVARFDDLSLATTGVFEDYLGTAIPF